MTVTAVTAAHEEPSVLAEQLASLSGPDIRVWLNNSGGWIALNWDNGGSIGRWDYVALFDTQPTDPYAYLSGQWQYTANQSSPYVTWTSAKGNPYYIAYISWDYSQSKYKILAWAGPSNP